MNFSEVPGRAAVWWSPTSLGSVWDIQLVSMAMVLSTRPIFIIGTLILTQHDHDPGAAPESEENTVEKNPAEKTERKGSPRKMTLFNAENEKGVKQEKEGGKWMF